MKFRRAAVILMFLSGGIIFFSCSNDLDLLAPAQTIPVVYGLIDASDSLHIVRVEKTFLSSGDPLEDAQVSDSIYFKDLTVLLNGIPMQNSIETFEWPDRKEGVFVRNPNLFYYLPSAVLPLEFRSICSITIQQNEQIIAGSSTTILPEFSVFAPQEKAIIDFNRPNITFRWADDPLISSFDISFEINLMEINQSDNQLVSLFWTLEENYVNSRISFEGPMFYDFLVGALEAIPGLQRSIQSIFVHFQGSGEAYSEFKRINRQNQGLTGFNNPPNFSNIDGGLGLFSSVIKMTPIPIELSPTTLDSLKSGSRTRMLGF